jgi:hypothetical protein
MSNYKGLKFFAGCYKPEASNDHNGDFREDFAGE